MLGMDNLNSTNVNGSQVITAKSIFCLPIEVKKKQIVLIKSLSFNIRRTLTYLGRQVLLTAILPRQKEILFFSKLHLTVQRSSSWCYSCNQNICISPQVCPLSNQTHDHWSTGFEHHHSAKVNHSYKFVEHFLTNQIGSNFSLINILHQQIATLESY